MQGVVFAWLVTMVLRESADRVGVAQMALLLPGTLLILFAGAIGDRIGLRKQAMVSQLFAALTPLLLIYALFQGALSYSDMIVYALLMGTALAFITPARDGLLNVVAGSNVQRMIFLTSLCQFGFQIVGYLLAGLTDFVGPIYILAVQCLALLFGAVGYLKMGDVEQTSKAKPAVRTSVLKDFWEGGVTVVSSSLMRAVMIQNVAMGCFFMGTFMVAMPLVLREVFAGSALDLAILSAVNSTGLVLTILVLLRVGHVVRAGRAVILSQVLGALVLVLAGAVNVQWQFTSLILIWGICGGLALPMSRSLMQQLAPPAQRGRVMSFYSFSFMGVGPVGALLIGHLAGLFGPQTAVVLAGLGMLVVVGVVSVSSPVWSSELPREPQ